MRIETRPYDDRIEPSNVLPVSTSISEEHRKPLTTPKTGAAWAALSDVGDVMVHISNKMYEAERLEERNRIGVELHNALQKASLDLQTDPNIKNLNTEDLLNTWNEKSNSIRDEVLAKSKHQVVKDLLKNDWALKNNDQIVNFTKLGWNNQISRTTSTMETAINQAMSDFIDNSDISALNRVQGIVQSGVGLLYDQGTADVKIADIKGKIKNEFYQRTFINDIRDSNNFVQNHKTIFDNLKNDKDLTEDQQSRLMVQLQSVYNSREQKDREWIREDWSTSIGYVVHTGQELKGVRAEIREKLGPEGEQRYDADVKLARMRYSEHQSNQRDASLTGDIKDSLVSARHSGVPIPGIENRIQDPIKRREYLEDAAMMTNLYDIQQQMVMATPEEAKKIFEERGKPEPGKEGYSAKLNFHQEMEGMWVNKVKTLIDDPAAYVVDKVKIPQALPVNGEYNVDNINIIEKNIDARLSEQKRQGLAENQLNPLTKLEIKTIKDKLESVEGEPLLNTIDNLKQVYGKHYDKVYQQLIDSGVGTTFELIDYASDQSSRIRIANIAKKPIKEYRDILGGDSSVDIRELRRVVDDTLKDYTATVVAIGGTSDGSVGMSKSNADRLARIKNNVLHVAMSYMVEGKDPRTAAKMATDIINNNFEYYGTFAVPKYEIINHKKVSYDGDFISSQLDAYVRNVFPNENDIMADEISKANIQAHGYWITNKAGDGVILMGQTGFPVRKTSGNIIEFKFRDIINKPLYTPELSVLTMP